MNGLKLLGHPMHPAIVHFPVAGWTAAVVTDVLFLALRDTLWWRISEWLLVVGVITALGAMTAGFIDLIALPPGGLAQQRALRHMYLMSIAWTIYLVDLLVRFLGAGTGAGAGAGAAAGPGPLMGWIGLALSVVGFGTLAVGTHFGAQLVYDLGVGQTGRKLS